MYSKCGHLENAEKCFSSMQKGDVISWGTIIAGYGCHGKGEDALRIFSEFLSTGIKPNSVIFLSIISACSHSGLIQQGLSIYQSMAQDFGIQPDREHHACIVDLLSRAGRVEEAYTFNKTVFKEPTGDVLGILLNACRVNGNIELGDIVARDMLRLKPVDAGNYVQLAQSYATSGRWGGVGQAWTQMRSLGLRKLPAWSSIELHGTIMTFFSDHNSQPHIEDIVSSLKSLNRNIRKMYTDREICI